jgi:hypothetical protein
VHLSIGSDSQVTRSWCDELRTVEYGQRLHLRQRNVAASPDQGEPATAARLVSRAIDGGGVAAGFKRWGLVPGARADLLVLGGLNEGTWPPAVETGPWINRPMRAELGWSATELNGALSLGLLAWGACALGVGALLCCVLLRAGGFAGAKDTGRAADNRRKDRFDTHVSYLSPTYRHREL